MRRFDVDLNIRYHSLRTNSPPDYQCSFTEAIWSRCCFSCLDEVLLAVFPAVAIDLR